MTRFVHRLCVGYISSWSKFEGWN